MAEAATNWIDFYVSLGPVVQTGVWAGVAVSALVTLRRPLRQLVEILVQRVTRGDNLTTPWFSLERAAERERIVVDQVVDSIRNDLSHAVEHTSKLSKSDDHDVILTAIDKARNRFVTIQFSPERFEVRSKSVISAFLYMTDWSTVSEFLDDVFNAAYRAGVYLPKHKYGSYWKLRNLRSGKVIEQRRVGGIDKRDFHLLDIRPGDILDAERINEVLSQ